MKRLLSILAAMLVLSACGSNEPTRVLVFTGTQDFRHGSTGAGVEAVRAIAEDLDFEVVQTDSSSVFAEDSLSRFAAVVFLNTSGDVLNHEQQASFERYIQAGGGFAGIHSAGETEKGWDWYGKLVGGVMEEPISDYPRLTPTVLTAADAASWRHSDEWYRIRMLSEDVDVLLRQEDERFSGGGQPVAWRHEFDGGRAFYTALGHDPASFETTQMREHLKSGLEYVLGNRDRLNYKKARTGIAPDENRFVRTVLADSLDEPTELELLGNGKVIFTERKGAVKIYDPASGTVRTIARLNVHTGFEDGLMGIALDPKYEENNWVYIYYSPAGSEPKQHLSRFILRNDSLQLDTEIVMLVVPTQRLECCHAAGSLEFGPDGNLFISTGDEANPFESNGFAPIDERPGRQPFDAQRTSANTNDLRGKILRITPKADGTYAIPEGNLFPPGTANTRPEIYVMGNRNPYRISIDQKTGYLYWGEVGPDAGEDDSTRGPRGHDEVNQARRAGFFGWPYFVGNNKPYRDHNFATKESGEPFNPRAPVNESPNNTGIRELPPAQPAYIWYPYAESPEFPIVRTGGRNAMAGPVFHADAFRRGDETFRDYFDGKLFIYDWMRGWILLVTMNEQGDLQRLEPFMPATKWNNPIDMAFDEDGVMYVLEYGTGWFKQNPDARLNRVSFNPGDRTPVAQISADSTVGAVPMTVTFTADGSYDLDGDELNYEWSVEGNADASGRGQAFTHTFTEPGVYTVQLRVSDEAGNDATDRMQVTAGNAPPDVEFVISGNRSFYWDGRRFDYAVRVTDVEDGEIASNEVRADAVYVAFDFLKQGIDSETLAKGHQIAAVPEGQQLMQESDCMACHSTAAQSIGPSFVDVALRYRDEPDAVRYLAAKIIQGGGGVWGEQAMAAHPQLTEAQAGTMVEYILSLTQDEREPGLPLKGSFATSEHEGDSPQGMYVLRAEYTDSGSGGVSPVTGREVHVLRNLQVQAEHFHFSGEVSVQKGREDRPGLVKNIYDGSFIAFRNVDLTGIGGLTYKVHTDALHSTGGRIELHLDSPDGPLVSSTEVPVQGGTTGEQELRASMKATSGEHDLYFVFLNERGITPEALMMLDWIRFELVGGQNPAS